MASSMEETQVAEAFSIPIELETFPECPVNDRPQVIGDWISGTVQGIFAYADVLVRQKLILLFRDKWILAGGGGAVHGNGMPSGPSGREGGDLEDGGPPGGLTDLQGGDGTPEGMAPDQEITDEGGSLGFMLLDDLTDTARVKTYLKHPKTYVIGLLIYELHSSFETLKEGFVKPTRAKKTLWYLLFGNAGTLFVLFTMLVLAPRGSAKARLLVKGMTTAGVLLFGLNLTMLFLKYQP